MCVVVGALMFEYVLFGVFGFGVLEFVFAVVAWAFVLVFGVWKLMFVCWGVLIMD